MATFVNKTSVVEAATIYLGGKLIGNDYTVSLPDVVPVTTDVGGLMGNMNVPLLNMLESMELTITKVGVDDNAAKMCSPGVKKIMAKWVQDQIDSSGNVKPIGCKAEFSCSSKSYMPTADIEVGSASEFDCKFEVSEYKLTIDGKCKFHVNRMTNVLKAWDGKKLVDYSAKFAKLL